ncbi:ribosyldihydronicotinamide dehydrogenase [quinone] isoform X4 [Phyllostomus discolor]|uniref:Ribosyldihydronicotinamide dehydrogenase [quinone] isoform X4 n=1 Tax=Phyllostomus discolor TaxID=89673 RepID=A0A7E6DTF0_9CHIR|nr:ribosyldihydronicotinamide dehydrogenase [quinone] isoform X4 [Phyllostomus discolor]
MAGKKVLIIYAHQEPRSFNGSLKKVAVDELHKQGCTVTVSDLYAMDFEPRATRKDITGPLSNPKFFSYGVEAYEAFKKRSLTSDILDEQKKVQEADLVIFQRLLPGPSVLQSVPVPSCLLRDQHSGAVNEECRVTCNDLVNSSPPHPTSTHPHCMPQSERRNIFTCDSPWVTPDCSVTLKRTAGFLLSHQRD